MMSASPTPHPSVPGWLHCGHDADPATDPVGCRGIQVAEFTRCLAHLTEVDRAAYLTTLSPGADLDHRGTPFTSDLLNRVLDALRDPTTQHPCIGVAHLEEAYFSGDAWFHEVTFSGNACFNGANFTGAAMFDRSVFAGRARFEGANFTSYASFDWVTFSDDAEFHGVKFSDFAGFMGALFSGAAWFHEATFLGIANFSKATFSGIAKFYIATFAKNATFVGVTFGHLTWFDGVTFGGAAEFNEVNIPGVAEFNQTSFFGVAEFNGANFGGAVGLVGAIFRSDVDFSRARFEMASHLGPLACDKRVIMDGAFFQQPIAMEMAAGGVSCVRTRWASTVTLQLRYAELDLRDAVFEYPVLVAARAGPFPGSGRGNALPESYLSGQESGVRLASVGGVDVANLALHDIDLSGCRFAGAIHLDQLKVDGWCSFAPTPSGWGWRFPWRWSRRNTLIEEHHWRVRTARHPGQAASLGWISPSRDAPDLKPAAVAALYRQLRKSLEDGKNEPDAADFYYGECEMRRHDITRPRGERTLITAYWALSGYGLRAIRALAWLVISMVATILMMVLWGLPVDAPKPQTTGQQVRPGQNLILTTDTPEPRNPTGPWVERVTTDRFEKALRVVINSVVFRSSGQDLTTAGTYIEMTSRLAEPVLLGLGVLAVRSRIKR
ncbi:pentapeptide repeat-containing protein [Streptomyces bobili]|uniref:pentapeptide repeat-containing protein n=1 Tax=Streptomyces bobili TaxID=67280 RepID=UPI00381ED8E2